MILTDIYNYLCSSKALSSLLGADKVDSKIYPNYARLSSKTPYIVYRSTNPGGTVEEVLSEEQCTLIITANTYLEVIQISCCLNALLDLNVGIPGITYKIHYSKQIGGSDYVDELGRHVRALNFTFKFSK